MLYWLWLSLKARSLLFFSASNPRITLEGCCESKYEVLMQLPERVRPRTIRISPPATVDEVINEMANAGLNFPVIFKPDIGERGFLVKRIFTTVDIENYLMKINGNFLIQELVDLPCECGVFYVRFPVDSNGIVTSIVLKEMLHAVGDGKSTVREIIHENDRAKLQWSILKESLKDKLDLVLKPGERLELNAIGNHCLGTKFLNGNSLLASEVSASFDLISKQMGDFYFGRFDLRCNAPEDLRTGTVKFLK